ncbi:MAG: DUF1697 domain-containing protein [Anaerolineales bacterium]
MSRWIAFLRAMNVGGHNVKMDRLRRLFESLGFTGVDTYLASGNIVFETENMDVGELEKQIEVAYAPFRQEVLDKAMALNVAFLHGPLEDEAVQKLTNLRTDIDDFHVNGREIYWLCRKKQSQSTFSNAVLEKTIGRPSTLRGINTIRRMVAKYVS